MKDLFFSPAFGNKPQILVGRDQDMKILIEGLQVSPGNKERARLIIGQRGLGKTVLLLEIAEYARKHGYIVSSPTVVSRDMLDRIVEKLEKDGELQFPADKPKITGGSVGILGFSAGIQTESMQNRKKSFAYQLLDLCERAEKSGKGVLILIDEVQGNNEQLKQLIIAYQEAVGEGKNLSVVFAGLPAAISRVLNEHVLTFFNRSAKLYLEPIAIPEIEIYFRDSFKKIGIKIHEDLLEDAAKETEGSPYLMQLIGHYITVSASDDGSISFDNYQNALRYAKAEYLEDICETTLAPLSERDIDFLREMAKDEGASAVKSIAERMGVDSSYTQRYKTRLIQAGVIEQKKRGYVQYAVPYLQEYFMNLEKNNR